MIINWNDAFLILAIAAMILGLDTLRRRNKALQMNPVVVLTATIEEIIDNTHGKLFEELMNRCPDCGGPPYYFVGPSANVQQNIFCSSCGQGYNVCEIVQFAERIHKDRNYIIDDTGRIKDGNASMG